LDELLFILQNAIPSKADRERGREAWATICELFPHANSVWDIDFEFEMPYQKAATIAYDAWLNQRRETAVCKGRKKWAGKVIVRTIDAHMEAIKQRLWHPDGRLMSRNVAQCRDHMSGRS
jgi:hypothetical protein